MTSRPYKIVVAEPYGDDALSEPRLVVKLHVLDSCDEASLIKAVTDADALLVRTYARITARVLAHAERLRVIGRGGVGLDSIDVAAARQRGIVVVHTPAAATHSVAELTVGLMIGLERHLAASDQSARSGQFIEARSRARGRELRGLTIGIVGLGRIGTCVARACTLGLGMRVLYNDIADIGPLDFPAESTGKADLFRASDVISLHVPLTPLTRGLIDAGVLETVKPTATLINTSRGALWISLPWPTPWAVDGLPERLWTFSIPNRRRRAIRFSPPPTCCCLAMSVPERIRDRPGWSGWSRTWWRFSKGGRPGSPPPWNERRS